MNKKIKYGLSMALIATASTVSVAIKFQNPPVKKAENAKVAADPAKIREVFGMVDTQISFFQAAQAAEDTKCGTIVTDAWKSCMDQTAKYPHGALGYFNNTLCMLNKGFPSFAEHALCKFNKVMEMNPDKAALPVSISKTMDSKTITMDVEKPTEAFATAAGYDAKGTAKIDGTTFVVVYWGGTGESSKGFMIHGANGLGDDKFVAYIQWDRTVADAQFVKLLAGKFTTAYLGATASDSATNPKGGDRGMYGHATYNSTTKAATAQLVIIEGQRGAGTPTTPACFRMYAEGTKGGTVTVAKTENAKGSTGHTVTSTFKDSTEMDAFQGTDAEATANGTGNLGAGQFGGMTVSFGKSCDDVNTAGATGKPFAGNNVTFTYGPSDVF